MKKERKAEFVRIQSVISCEIQISIDRIERFKAYITIQISSVRCVPDTEFHHCVNLSLRLSSYTMYMHPSNGATFFYRHVFNMLLIFVMWRIFCVCVSFIRRTVIRRSICRSSVNWLSVKANSTFPLDNWNFHSVSFSIILFHTDFLGQSNEFLSRAPKWTWNEWDSDNV